MCHKGPAVVGVIELLEIYQATWPVGLILTKLMIRNPEHCSAGAKFYSFHQWPSKGYLRSPKVTINQPFFANNFWSKRDRDVRVVLLCFSHQDASINVQCDLLRSPRDTLTWGHVLTLTFPRSCYTCFDASWRGKHDGVKIIALSFQKRKLSKNCFAQKCRFWPFVTSDT